jgi:hypothetical protein
MIPYSDLPRQEAGFADDAKIKATRENCHQWQGFCGIL